MTSPGPAFQICTGSCNGFFSAEKMVCIIQSAINRWTDRIGQDRDSHHLDILSTILQQFTLN